MAWEIAWAKAWPKMLGFFVHITKETYGLESCLSSLHNALHSILCIHVCEDQKIVLAKKVIAYSLDETLETWSITNQLPSPA